ncbi:hypothetical protein Pcinc_010069 [Petrolisthes cinctipes]|uniref:ADP-ribosylhydrolase ARH3 n=1 Tax=Petrolisthes cinctipes TaxID=88211 RepID=A0AAE1G5H1_PETCI|nr:hypothetical protein Pcinc_010069 [Petrolisthes cinctipes]
MEAVELLVGRFRGSMVGALMGDCLGAPFEAEPRAARSVLNSYFKRLSCPDIKVPYKAYTDDTAMTRCVALSLIQEKGYNAEDMAKRFVKEFYAEPRRGYGSNVVDVFAALRISKFEDVYGPAAWQFGGSGSYGNGGAMRVAPVALFYHPAPDQKVVSVAKDMALITHGNRLGYNGAVLQCLAIREALHTPTNQLDVVKFIQSLKEMMKKVETLGEDEILEKGQIEFEYTGRLSRLASLMERGDQVSIDAVEEELGNDISAHRSVPTAIYSFLRASNSIPNIEAETAFMRTIHYAISLGGDTDTIASMAGSIAGAFYGIAEIPESLQRHCEGLAEAIQQADQLHSLATNTHPPPS